MENVINYLKKLRKKNSITRKYFSKYAFVGIGNHSINNLYPVLNYLNVYLKYIVTKSVSTADMINKNFENITASTDFDEVLNDSEINGIIICSNPQSHFDLVKKSLSAHKHVFVEKPPCSNMDELNELIKLERSSQKTVVTGFQKRYSECSKILQQKLSENKIISYNYLFHTGAYPEGDCYTDLFIHPLDLLCFLFGNPEILSIMKNSNKKGQESLFLHLKHGNICGNIEISTQYSWNQPLEQLTVNTDQGVFLLENHNLLTFNSKPQTILSIPTEKIFNTIPTQKILFNGNNFLPVFSNNQIVSQGYFNEIKTFLDIAENKKTKNLSTLSSIVNTYKLMEQIVNYKE